MKLSKYIFFIFIISVSTLLKIKAGNPNDSTYFEIVSTQKQLKQAGINVNLINCLQFDPRGFYVFATPTQFYAGAADTILKLGKTNSGTISSFAFTNEGLLMAIRNNELCYLDSTGYLKKAFQLPSYGMGIAGSKYAMYIYDKTGNKSVNGVYALLHGGNYKLLFKVDKPIEALAEANGKIYYSYQNSILCYDIASKNTDCILKLQNANDKIISIAVDKNTEVVYFSTPGWMGYVKNNDAQVISKKSGGILDMTSGAITILNQKPNFLIRIVGNKFTPTPTTKAETNKNMAVPASTVTNSANNNAIENTKPATDTKNKTTASSEILTNESIIKLTNAKLTDDIIIELIKSRKVDFDLSVDALVSLSEKGVSSAVIKEMKAAMDRKNKK